MKTIAACWNGFRKALIKPGISELQISEMRACYYAGANDLYALIMSKPRATRADTEDLRNELIQFGKSLQNNIT